MGAFRKRSSAKYRVIYDLSWPPHSSVNRFIPKEDFSLKYITIQDIVRRVSQCGNGSYTAKLDLAEAFKQILVRPYDWELLGFTFDLEDT